jgi:hypothetical protein
VHATNRRSPDLRSVGDGSRSVALISTAIAGNNMRRLTIGNRIAGETRAGCALRRHTSFAREDESMNIYRHCAAIIQRLRYVSFGAAVMALGVALAVWSLAPPPAGALNNRQQILTGGGSQTQGGLSWTAPGFSNVFGNDFPSAGAGETAAQLRMSGGGVLSLLWVRVNTATVPTSGNLTVMVRVNGADTTLTCTVLASGQCQSGAASVTIPNGARLAVRIANTFPDSGNVAYSYTMLLD